ncbi:CRISPR-associated protein Cas6 [Thermotomaculum hydrothermale]|uniref:CRISPR-associated endoribonuclease n=1 Tax=Thermotomaculum hydrothermale TaxID=981385 RepID=A0A7R6PP61_9BACT|nr:CRISPR-associated endoribonuclease Cas6 [Thermotomaculum hydrothermale]BBB31811.1 CRISPR-associated protein Cas6 [Thermotomaculum hydrothermale]
MRLKLCFQSEKKIILGKGYLSQLQGLIYNLLDKASANWLHQEGFKHKNRFFKLFVYSEIMEKGELKGNNFIFPPKISFYLASPIDWILEQIVKNSVFTDEFQLGNNTLQLCELQTIKSKNIDGEKLKVRVRTLSPVEVHSTFISPEGNKKTIYYPPIDNEFSKYINLNLRKKWEILNEKECPYNISIKPVNFSKCKVRRINVKGTSITGWKGHFFLEGDTPLINLAFDTGLGTRNSLGFGFIEEVRNDRSNS